MPDFSVAVEKARQRRVATTQRNIARVEWYIDNVINKIELTMEQRVKLATNLLKNQVIKNISVPVTKASSVVTRRIVVLERSKPGEFPRADTTQLMKTIFDHFQRTASGPTGYICTPLDYGVILETRMARSFLVRTLRELQPTIIRILTGPITGATSGSTGL